MIIVDFDQHVTDFRIFTHSTKLFVQRLPKKTFFFLGKWMKIQKLYNWHIGAILHIYNDIYLLYIRILYFCETKYGAKRFCYKFKKKTMKSFSNFYFFFKQNNHEIVWYSRIEYFNAVLTPFVVYSFYLTIVNVMQTSNK